MIKPEKSVEKSVLAWCFQNKILVNVCDSRGTYSESQKRYTKNRGLPVGFPDLSGLNSQGRYIAIELKAEGKEGVARLAQLQHLVRVINSGGFGCVTSSVEHIDDVYRKWLCLDFESQKTFLLSCLPKKALINNKTVNFTI